MYFCMKFREINFTLINKAFLNFFGLFSLFFFLFICLVIRKTLFQTYVKFHRIRILFRRSVALNLKRNVFYFFKHTILDKRLETFTKLSKIGFSMECFTADFLYFFAKKGQNLAFGWMAGYSPSNPSISEIFLKFTNFLKPEVLIRSVPPEATRTFAFWW